MIVLGVGYAAAQNLLWTLLPHVLAPNVLMLGAGLMACSLNLLPTLLPAVAFRGDGRFDFSLLAGVAVMGVVAFLLACLASCPSSALCSTSQANAHAVDA